MSSSPVTSLGCSAALSTSSAGPWVCVILVMRAVSGTLFAGRQLAPISALSKVDLPATQQNEGWDSIHAAPVLDVQTKPAAQSCDTVWHAGEKTERAIEPQRRVSLRSDRDTSKFRNELSCSGTRSGCKGCMSLPDLVRASTATVRVWSP